MILLSCALFGCKNINSSDDTCTCMAVTHSVLGSLVPRLLCGLGMRLHVGQPHSQAVVWPGNEATCWAASFPGCCVAWQGGYVLGSLIPRLLCGLGMRLRVPLLGSLIPKLLCGLGMRLCVAEFDMANLHTTSCIFTEISKTSVSVVPSDGMAYLELIHRGVAVGFHLGSHGAQVHRVVDDL